MEGWTGAGEPRPESFQPANQRSREVVATSNGKLAPTLGTPMKMNERMANARTNTAIAAPHIPEEPQTRLLPRAMA